MALDLSMMLSEHLSLREMLRSYEATRLGMQNIPEEHHVAAMRVLAAQVEKVRALFGRPLGVSSGYRSRALNTAVNGSRSSQHCRGEALDFEVEGVDNLEGCRRIAASGLEFDQLILEFYTAGDPRSGWIHFSYRREANRKQILTAFLKNKKVIYKPGLPDGNVI